MRVLTFKGGIHPPDGKEFTNNMPVEVVFPKKGWEMAYPLSQHIGAPCEPIVQVGDKVLMGQKIAESSAFVSAPIHSTVSGEVKDIRDVMTPGGVFCKAIIVENDGEQKEHESIKPNANYKALTRDQILTKIKEAGIVGMGGAGFPTHIKLNPPPEKKIEYIIVNAAECEPFLTTDHRVLLEEPDKLIIGLQIIMSLHKGAKGIIAVETNKLDAIKILEDLCKDIPDIEIVGLVPKYPQGSEKQLIYACTKREVPSGGLPADVGCIVNNVDTVIAVHRAIVRGRPLMRRIVTITGGAAVKKGNYKVLIGTSLKDLLEETNSIGDILARKIISGGPMMGVALYDTNVPIIKTSSAFLLFTEQEAELPPEQNCIRCGRCVETCPAGLMPLLLNQNVLADNPDQFKTNNGMDCIECGSCSYVCPAKRHLTQSIRVTRRELLSKK